MMMKAMLMKVEFVLEIARKDARFCNDLSRDPYRTLEASGIDLSQGEAFAVLDLVKGTTFSPLAHTLGALRERWSAILMELSDSSDTQS